MRSMSTSVKVIIAAVGAFLAYTALRALVSWVATYWVTIVTVTGLALVLAVGVFLFRRHQTAALRAEYAELERHLAAIDGMDVPEFEEWISQLLRRDGFRKIRFVGRVADLGGDFIATTPDDRRVMIRAKSDDGTLSKRGARHIQALGAHAHARFKADAAMLVTNADLHRVKTAARHDALAAQLGVVLVDRRELALWSTDQKPPAELTATPAEVG
ncbi:Restriction endonuclease [Stackebrandtia soli]